MTRMSAKRGLLALSVVTALCAGLPAGAAAAGSCEAISQREHQLIGEQVAFTTQSYSDGKITPEEAAQTQAYSQEIAKARAELKYCNEHGQPPPPGYKAVPDATPPSVTSLKVSRTSWHIGARAVKISWKPSERSSAKITFARVVRHGKQVVVGSLSAPMGASSISFKGKVARPGRTLVAYKLKPGTYRLSLKATDAAGNVERAPVLTTLKIKPRLAPSH